jgi:hypothetical protein
MMPPVTATAVMMATPGVLDRGFFPAAGARRVSPDARVSAGRLPTWG